MAEMIVAQYSLAPEVAASLRAERLRQDDDLVTVAWVKTLFKASSSNELELKIDDLPKATDGRIRVGDILRYLDEKEACASPY